MTITALRCWITARFPARARTQPTAKWRPLFIGRAFDSKLADAFAAVREIHAETPPDPRTCEHRIRTQHFSRELAKTSVCELCGAVIGGDAA